MFFLSNRSGVRSDPAELNDVLPDISGLSPGDRRSALQAFCSSHDPLFERDAHCLHAGIAGTLSSSIIELNVGGSFSYRFSQGPPCENEYRSVEVPDSFRDNVLGAWRQGEPSPQTDL